MEREQLQQFWVSHPLRLLGVSGWVSFSILKVRDTCCRGSDGQPNTFFFQRNPSLKPNWRLAGHGGVVARPDPRHGAGRSGARVGGQKTAKAELFWMFFSEGVR